MSFIDPWNKILRYPEVLDKIRRGERVYPINVEFDLTEDCNCHCAWCAFRYMHSKDTMSTELAERAITECADVGVKALTFTGGGEPTLHPRFADLVRYAKEQGLAVGLYTNGIRRQALIEAAPYLDWAYISLDEADPRAYKRNKGVNAWWAVCGNVQAIAGKTIVGVGFLLHGDNYRQAPKMQEIAHDMGADYCQFRPVVGLDDYDWVPECLQILQGVDGAYISWERFQDVLEERPRKYTVCRASAICPCIGADGTVWVCPHTRGLRPLGNLNDESLREIWERREEQVVGPDCRIACRNHALNETLEYVCSDAPHMEFV